ncbi:MAG: hypothetical protein OXT73_01340 [Bacteroidota bacterium]|nr:hypothetical protein [Bacteroidota bacterium]
MSEPLVPAEKPAKRRRFGLRGSQVLYGLVFATGFLLGMGFHFQQWSAQEPAGMTMYLLFGVVTTLGFASL